MTLRTLKSKIHRNFSDYGLVRGVSKSALYALQPFYKKTAYRIYGLDVQAANPFEPTDGQFVYRLLLDSDLDAIRQVESMAEWLEGKIAERIRTGSLCCAAMHGEQVVAFNLVSLNEVTIPLVELRWRFQPNEAWSEHISTHRDWRNLGLATNVRHRVISALKQQDIEWFFGGTIRDHAGTLKLASRVGFTELGDIRYRRVFNYQNWSFEGISSEHNRHVPQPFDGLGQFSADQLPVQPPTHRT